MAFNAGVADALVDSGIRVADGPMIGSSAGSWTASSLVCGLTFDDVLDAWESHQMDRPVRVIDIARPLYGDRKDNRVTGMAIHLPLMIRVGISGATHTLADVVAASSSPPRMASPHRIGIHHYIDSVTRYSAADRSPEARLQVVVTPLGGRVLGHLGWIAERTTRYEMSRWRQRYGGALLFVRPTRAIAELCEDSNSLFRMDVARATYPLSYQLGLECAARFKARHPELAAEIVKPPQGSPRATAH